MTHYVKTFVQKNLYAIFVGFMGITFTILGFYIGIQLFQQSTNFKVAALQNDVDDIKQSIKNLSNLNSKVDVIGTKIDGIIDRQDRQGDTLKTLLINQ